MGGNQHMALAYAIADALGIRNASVFAEASALPDTMRGFPHIHHSRGNAQYVAQRLWDARRYGLSGRTSDRDYYLGYALHFLADGLSPYSGGERYYHGAFESALGRLVKRDAFRNVQGYAVRPEDAASWVADKMSREYPRLAITSDYARAWAVELYRISVCAVAAVVLAPAVHHDDERNANALYTDAQLRLSHVRSGRNDLDWRRGVLIKAIRHHERQVPPMLNGTALAVGAGGLWVVLASAWLGPAALLMWTGSVSLLPARLLLGILWALIPAVVDILSGGAERPGAWLPGLPSPRAWLSLQWDLLPMRRDLWRMWKELRACRKEAKAIRGRYVQQFRAAVRPRPWYRPPPERSAEISL